MGSRRIDFPAAGRAALALWIILTAGSAAAPAADVPKVTPLPAEAPAPADNPTEPAKVALGEKLFFDPVLSGDDQLSCASCHAPEQAFADGKATSEGANGRPLERNTPTVLNAAFFDALFWDGRAASLEEQALAPIEAAEEMAQDVDALVGELEARPDYVADFQAAFGGGVTAERIAQALAAYQRTLLTPDAPFDRYLAGDEDAISDFAKQGWEIFQRNGCIDCHNGPLLSDGQYYRLQIGGDDTGRERVTGDPEDRYRFRTPTLRNVAETAPYFHDGSVRTLFDAVAFYYRRTTPPRPGLELDFQPLAARSYSEIDALVAFLRTLSADPE